MLGFSGAVRDLRHAWLERGALKVLALLLLVVMLSGAVTRPELAATIPAGIGGAGPTAERASEVQGAREASAVLEYIPPVPGFPGTSLQLEAHAVTYRPTGSERQLTATYNRSMGDHKALTLLVDFQDITHAAANNQSRYDAFANANGSSDRSLRTFYFENSAGNYTLNTTVVDWVTMPHNMSYYSTASGENKIAVDAAQAADSAVDFSLFDEDGDGYVDNLIVVHAGNDQAVTANTSEIWSFEGSGNTVSVDNKTVKVFATVAENITNGDPLGVLCHEFGHLGFDLPDLYDVNLNNAGLGDWDTMAYGGWAGGGNQPNGFSAWTKLSLGWIAPYVPQSSVDNYTIYPMTNSSERNPVKIESNYTNEYFLVEFRWRNSSLRFDRYVPASGLVIYHVDETTISSNLVANTVETNGSHKGIDVEEVGTQDMDSSSSNTGDSNDVWVNNTTGFTPTSSPNSNLYRNSSAYATGIRVFSISTVNTSGGPHMTFSIDPGRGSFALAGTVLGNNSTQSVQGGAAANFTVQFTTASSTGDNVTLSTEGTFGGATVSLNRTNLTLGSLGSGTVNLTVTLPSNCSGGTAFDVQVRANSTSQPSSTVVVSTRTVCAQVYAGNLTGASTFNATVNVTLSQNFTLRNAGNGADNFTISASFNASVINISLSLQVYMLAGGANVTVQVNFTVQNSVADGTSTSFSLDAAYGPSAGRHAFLNGTVTARSFALSGAVLGNNSTQAGQPGAAVNFTVQFTTASSAGDNVTLSAEASLGNATVSLDRTSLNLGALGSGTVNLTVTLPSNCSAGAVIDIQVRANSTSQPSSTFAVSTRTICALVYGGNLTGPSSFNATANMTLAQNFTVRNAGNGPDNFTLSASYNASLINVSLSAQVYGLASGANVTIRVNFTVQGSVPDGTVIPFSLDATYGPSAGLHMYLNGTVTARAFALSGTVLGNNSTQSGPPGAAVNFTVQFTTASSTGDGATLTVEGSFGGAGVILNRTNLTLGPLGSGTVNLTVTLPSNCTAGTAVDVQVRANSTNQPSSTVSVSTRTVCAQVFAGNLTGPSAFNASVNVTLSQNFTVRNAGNGADNFTLSASYNGSLLNVSLPAQIYLLASGANVTVRVNFTVQGAVAEGTAIGFSLDVAYGPSAARHMYLNGTVTARNFALSGTVLGNNSTQSGQPGVPLNFTVQFTTASSIGDNVTLAIEGSFGNATVALNRTSLTLGSLGSGTVNLTVTLPTSCSAGAAFDVQVRANSTSQPSITAVISTRTVCAQVYGGNLTGPSSFNGTVTVTVSQNFTLRNTGNGVDNFTVSATFNGSLVNVSLSPQVYFLASGANVTVRVNFTVQSSVADGTSVPFWLDAAFGPSAARHLTLNGSITARVFGLSGTLLGNNSTQTGQPAVPVNFAVQFTTSSSTGDVVTLAAEGSFGGATVALNRTNLTLGPLGSGTLNLTVTLPANCAAGDVLAVQVRANSTNQPSSTFAVTARTVCAQVFAGTITGPLTLDALVNATVVQNFTLRNTGNGADNFTLSATFNGSLVNISLPSQAFSLAGGASAIFQVNFTVAGFVTDGTSIPFTLQAAHGPAFGRLVQVNGTVTGRTYGLSGVALDGPLQGALPGASVNFTIQFTTYSATGDNVTLSTEGTFGNASVSLDRTSLALGGLGSGTVTLTVTMAGNCLPGDSADVRVRGNATTQAPFTVAVSTLTVCDQLFAASLTGTGVFNATPTLAVGLNFTVRNTGSGADNLTLTASYNASLLDISLPAQTLALPRGTFATVEANFTLASSVLEGASVAFTLDLAFGPEGGRHAYLNGTITAGRLSAISLRVDALLLELLDPGQPRRLNFTVQNDGNYLADVALSASAPGGVTVDLDSASVQVAAFSSVTVGVTLTASADTLAGTQGEVSLAASVPLPAAQAFAGFAIFVNQRFALSLSGPSSAAAPRGAVVSLNLTALNLGNGLDNATLLLSTTALGWNERATPTMLAFGTTNATRSGAVLFEATVPQDALANSQQEFIVTVRSQQAGVSATLRILVLVLSDISFTIGVSGPQRALAPPEVAAFAVTIGNTGNLPESFSLTAQGLPAGWAVDPPSGATATLFPGESLTLWLNITPAANATGGIYSFQIAAALEGNASQAAVLDESVEIAAHHEVQLSVPSLPGDFAPGAQVLITISVRNLGNVAETVALSWSGSFVSVTFTPGTATVAAFSEARVSVVAVIQSDAPAGDALLLLTGSSSDKAFPAASASVVIHVLPPSPPPPPAPPPPPPGNNTTAPPNGNSTVPPAANNTTSPPPPSSNPPPSPPPNPAATPLADATGILLAVAAFAALTVSILALRRRRKKAR